MAGRSSTLLKVKSFKDDEAVVIEHQPGTGRHKGRMGALLVRLASGTRRNRNRIQRQAGVVRYQELSRWRGTAGFLVSRGAVTKALIDQLLEPKPAASGRTRAC